MEYPDPSLMQTQLSAKGQTIKRKSHAEAHGPIFPSHSPHTRRVANFYHAAWDAVQLGQLNHHLKKEYGEVHKEFKKDQKNQNKKGNIKLVMVEK